MQYKELRERVCAANLEISANGLAILTWGNASEADREAGVFAIKPSGVDYTELTPDKIPVLSIESGEQVYGDLRPSSDTATHAELFRAFEDIGGVVHTHSTCATSWAQAYKSIACFGTTHADHFYGEIPCTDPLSEEDVRGDYERNTGRVIVEFFKTAGLDAAAVPAVLVGGHGPFAWGGDAAKAVEAALVLENVAKMALQTLQINPASQPVGKYLLDRHYFRKHGENAYYGN